MTIKFYRERDQPYGSFSNFSKHPFELNGNSWKTVEHYFQAQKFCGTLLFSHIKDSPTPKDAKLLGNSREYPLRNDWDEVKDSVMLDAVYAKFRAHSDILGILLSTGDQLIVEAAMNDAYWGSGPDGDGRNQLGKTLMAVRDRLRAEVKG